MKICQKVSTAKSKNKVEWPGVEWLFLFREQASIVTEKTKAEFPKKSRKK